MGLDYSFLLYFERRRLWDALDGLAAIADPVGPSTRVDLPDTVIRLPFEAWAGTPARLKAAALPPEINLMTCLNFAPDEALEEYRERNADPIPDPNGPISVGYIYLSVHCDLSTGEYGETDPDLVLFQLTAATTSMSILFTESPSIRATLIRLLGTCGGVCGILDREDGGGELIWFRGEESCADLPDPYMPLREIEELLK
jgi:hypothetical protein